MYCKNCGQRIDDKASICIYCGVSTTDRRPAQETAPQKTRVNGLGIAGFVVSLLSLGFGFWYCILSIIGLVLSIVGMAVKSKYTSCNGLAIAGLVLGIVSLVIWGIVLIVAVSIGTSLFGFLL